MSEIPLLEKKFSARSIFKLAGAAVGLALLPNVAEAYSAPVLRNQGYEVPLQAADSSFYRDLGVNQKPWSDKNWFPQKDGTSGLRSLYSAGGPLDALDQMVRNQNQASEARAEGEWIANCDTGRINDAECLVEGDPSRSDLGYCDAQTRAAILFPEPSSEQIIVNGVVLNRFIRVGLLTAIGAYQGVDPIEDVDAFLANYQESGSPFAANMPEGIGPGVWYRAGYNYNPSRNQFTATNLGNGDVQMSKSVLLKPNALMHLPVYNLIRRRDATPVQAGYTAYRANSHVKSFEDFILRAVYFKPQ